MIGNDVVDLAAAARESNWRRKGFLEKVFSSEERAIISSATNQHQMVWLLWSMKEAAYKAHQREFQLPRKLTWQSPRCSVKISSEKASGTVKIGEAEYFTSSEISETYIHTSAVKEKNTVLKKGIFEGSSREIKGRLLQEISSMFPFDKAGIKLEKDVLGMPFFSYKNQRIFDQFSLSGHGKYSAYLL